MFTDPVFETFSDKNIKEFLVGLFFENDEPSLTRTLSSLCFLMFAVVSAYLLLNNIRWDHYNTFATISAGGGFLTRIADKVIMNKLASSEGVPFDKGKSIIQYTFKEFLVGLLYEGGKPSLTRVVTTISILSFISASIYLVSKGFVWVHYDTFAELTGGGGLIARVVDKGIMNKLASPEGVPYTKNNTPT